LPAGLGSRRHLHGDLTAASADLFHLRWRPQDATLRFVVAGEAAAFDFATRVETVAAAAEVKFVTMDLTGVGFGDSAGLGALIATHEQAKHSASICGSGASATVSGASLTSRG
jgi:hypothetical protein